jgi:hypothetical protein
MLGCKLKFATSSFHNHPKLTKQCLVVQQDPVSVCHEFPVLRHALACAKNTFLACLCLSVAISPGGMQPAWLRVIVAQQGHILWILLLLTYHYFYYFLAWTDRGSWKLLCKIPPTRAKTTQAIKSRRGKFLGLAPAALAFESALCNKFLQKGNNSRLWRVHKYKQQNIVLQCSVCGILFILSADVCSEFLDRKCTHIALTVE